MSSPSPDEALIAVDTDGSGPESDSAYGDDLSTFTQSLTSSVLNYAFENGRRYHAFREGAYAFPNDERENERLDMQHHMLTMAIGDKLHLAPISSNLQSVLDIGTGTGMWCIQMGDDYPSAQILGNDLSAAQYTFVPPNVKFEVDDVESEWTFQKPFDYIHSRSMMVSILDWPKLVKNCFDFVTPGGWVEFQDYDLQWYSEDETLKPDSSLAKWLDLFYEGASKTGRDHRPGIKLEGWVRDAGFTEIYHQKFRLPVGRWPKDERLKMVGAWNLINCLEGIEGFTMGLFTRMLGWTAEEVQVLLAGVRKDLRNPKIHVQQDFHVVYGRKPAADP